MTTVYLERDVLDFVWVIIIDMWCNSMEDHLFFDKVD